MLCASPFLDTGCFEFSSLLPAAPLLSRLPVGCTVGAFGVEGSLPSFSSSVHQCVSAESLTPRSDRPSLRVIKVPLLKVQVPQGSTVKSSGSTRFHIKVPFVKVQVPQVSI